MNGGHVEVRSLQLFPHCVRARAGYCPLVQPKQAPAKERKATGRKRTESNSKRIERRKDVGIERKEWSDHAGEGTRKRDALKYKRTQRTRLCGPGESGRLLGCPKEGAIENKTEREGDKQSCAWKFRCLDSNVLGTIGQQGSDHVKC